MSTRCEFPICVKISSEASKEHRELFGSLARKELQTELTYYIKKHEQAGRTFKQQMVLNYDNVKAVFLERLDEKRWDIVGFGKAEEYFQNRTAVEEEAYSVAI